MRRVLFHAFAILAMGASLAGGLSGCAGKAVNQNDPVSLYNDALSDIDSDHYMIALEKLRSIKNKFPYSKVSVEAQLKIADVYFLQESWPEAAAAYETFRDLHPKNEKVAYAMFRIGKSYFNDIPSTVARDLTSAQKAVDAYNDFLRRFPNDPKASEARKDMDKAREDLADKELYIGDFYFKRDYYTSARPRYQKILDLYPETDAARKAKEKLAKIDEILAKSKKEAAH